jgi:hypothetical protein
VSCVERLDIGDDVFDEMIKRIMSWFEITSKIVSGHTLNALKRSTWT